MAACQQRRSGAGQATEWRGRRFDAEEPGGAGAHGGIDAETAAAVLDELYAAGIAPD